MNPEAELPNGTGDEVAESTQPSPVDEELQHLTERLRETSAEPEPLGMCVFGAGVTAVCAETTAVQCALLVGTWRAGSTAGAESPAQGNSADDSDPSVRAKITELETKLASVKQEQAEETGVCVYAAGTKACRGEMTMIQCELLGGIWFPADASSAETSASER